MNRIAASLLLALLSASLACGAQEKTCAADQRLCSNACVSLQSDARNCGACGNACGAGQGCAAGACVDCASSPTACATEVLAACGNLNQVRGVTAGLTAAGAPFPTDGLPISLARVGDTFYVANSVSSSVSEITLSPPRSTTGADAIAITSAPAGFPDLEFLAAHDGLLWASNASTTTLVVIDPASRQVVKELPLPAGANPQGIAFTDGKAYLALKDRDEVAVLDASSVAGLRITSTISLSALAPAGARSMPSRVLAAGSRLYVALNGLDPNTFAPPRGTQGRLAVVDLANETPTALELGPQCLNPGGMAVSGTTLWVACGFAYAAPGDPMGGALVAIDVSGGSPAAPATIALAGHAVGSVAICDGRGYAGATESGNVVSFDPATRATLGEALVCPASNGFSYVSDVICAR